MTSGEQAQVGAGTHAKDHAPSPVASGGAEPSAHALLPADLVSFTTRVLGECTLVADHSWPYEGSEVRRVRASDGREYFVKRLQDRKFFDRELAGYEWAAALGPGRAPDLVAADRVARAVILTILPGVILKRDAGLAASDESMAYEQAGELLARLHGAVPPCRDSSVIDRLVGNTEGHLQQAGSELTIAQRARVRACALSLKRLAPQLRSVATHGDFQPRNLMWEPGTRSLGVIDFERAELAPAVRDFALLESGVFQDRPDLKATFTNGYGREFDSLEVRALRAWITVDAASAVAWGISHQQQGLIDRARRAFAPPGADPRLFWDTHQARAIESHAERLAELADRRQWPFDGTWCDFQPHASWEPAGLPWWWDQPTALTSEPRSLAYLGL